MPMGRRLRGASKMCSANCIQIASNSLFLTIALQARLPRTKDGGLIIFWRRHHWHSSAERWRLILSRDAQLIHRITPCYGPTSLSSNSAYAAGGHRSPPACGVIHCKASTGSNSTCSANLVRRFCSINGSTIDPQLIHRHTNVSGEKSGLHSSTINPWHRPHVMAGTSLGMCLHARPAHVEGKITSGD